MSTSQLDLAYIAGLLDGEAYIGIKKSKAYKCQDRKTPGYHARIQVRMVDKEAIAFITSTFGGGYYEEPPRAAKGRPLFCFQASDKRAEEILSFVLPFLRVKRRSAQKVLELRQLQRNSRKHRTKVTGYREFPNAHGTVRKVRNLSFSDEYVAMCEALYVACKELNRVGV